MTHRSRTTRWTGRFAILLAAATASGGCYSYQPVDGAVPRAPETVRVELTGAGQDAMRERRGIVLDRFEGEVLSESGDELTMDVRLPANSLAFGGGTGTVRDTLEILRPHMRSVDVKQFSTGRTVLGIGAAVGGAALIYAVVDAALSSDGNGGGEPGNDEFSLLPVVGAILNLFR